MPDRKLLIYNKNHYDIRWLAIRKREAPKMKFQARKSGFVHATIFAAKEKLFRRYAEEWVKRMKLRFPNDIFLEPLEISSLEKYLAFLQEYSDCKFNTLAFFGHGFAGGFIFDGKDSHYTNALVADLVRDEFDLMVSNDKNVWKSIAAIKKHPFSESRPMFTENTNVYFFSCWSADCGSVGSFSIGFSISTYYSCNVFCASGRIFYLEEGFGFADKPVENRSSQYFMPFRFIKMKSGEIVQEEQIDFFENYP